MTWAVKIMYIWTVLVYLYYIPTIIADDYSACSEYSVREEDEFWDAISRCSACTAINNCGYCQSSLQCLAGTLNGPLDGSPCPMWSFTNDTCPTVPNCNDYNDCNGCAVHEQCAWCASENVCTTIADAFTKDCRGLV